ncbi:MAG: DUF882 domain-containing protein [Chitinophagaceae bacterium]|nr:DUF882 domain-containing protein [Chitinophagaceae bacterium]
MKWLFRIILSLIILSVLVFFLYCNNLSLADKQTVTYYKTLKKALKQKGYRPRLLVISTRRLPFHNNIQVNMSGAAPKSRHLSGEAIDFLVLDVNRDGKATAADVDIVVKILEEEIMKGNGGIGTYKQESSFINRQMVHIDCRKGKGRWER